MALKRKIETRIKIIVVLLFGCLVVATFWKRETFAERTRAATPALTPTAAGVSTPASPAAEAQNPPPEGCLNCHNKIEPMHRYNATGDVFDALKDGKDAQGLSCTSCHGGNPAATTQKDAHVQPRFPNEWNCKDSKCSSRNPERTNTLIAKESSAFVRFINPGDFRVVAQSCGECHTDENKRSSRSMMAHGAMLWGAALYNNGSFPIKDARFGESYDAEGNPQALFQRPKPTRQQEAFKGFVQIGRAHV